jgi:hypothetical protein
VYNTTCAAAIPLPAKSPAKIQGISSLLLMVSYLSMEALRRFLFVMSSIG